MPCGKPSVTTESRLTATLTHGTDYVFGSVVTYSCPEGYNVDGFVTQTCMATKLWDNPQPSCAATECAVIVAPDNGAVTGPSVSEDSWRLDVCPNVYAINSHVLRFQAESHEIF